MEVRVTLFHRPPFVIVDGKTNSTSGYLLDVWRFIEESLNFTSAIYVDSFQILTTPEWEDRDVSLVPHVAASALLDDFTYTNSFLLAGYGVYFRRTYDGYSSKSYVKSFSLKTWIVLLITSLITIITLCLIHKIYNHKLRLNEKIDFTSYVLQSMSNLTNQGICVNTNLLSIEILIVIQLIMGSIVYNCYSSTLLSHTDLSNRVVKPEWRDVLNKPPCTEEVELWSIVCRYKLAVVSGFHIINGQNENLMKMEFCQLTSLKERIMNAGISIVLNKNFVRRNGDQFVVRINQRLQKLSESGIKKYLEIKWFRVSDVKADEEMKLRQITLEHILGIFNGLLIFVLLSIIVLIFEILSFRKTK